MLQTVVAYATSSGGTTIDSDSQGGNPFASALIDVSAEVNLELRRLLPRVRALTIERSGGHQIPEYTASESAWCLSRPSPVGYVERRVALVLIVSDYSSAGSYASLEGAAHDERRLAGMLATNGFSVEQGVSPRRTDILAALRAFRRRSSQADVGVIYCTGHGIETDGEVFLLPGDFRRHAGLSLSDVHAGGR